jgi:hypothetical protein
VFHSPLYHPEPSFKFLSFAAFFLSTWFPVCVILVRCFYLTRLLLQAHTSILQTNHR